MNDKGIKLTKELIVTNLEAQDWENAIEKIAIGLFQRGYVKKSYMKAVKDREKKFPTGLPTEGVGVAIPHTDVEHVNKPAISIGVLKKPVLFQTMGMPEESVEVEIIFMLAIKEPHKQLEVLQNLMNIFQHKEVLEKIRESQEAQEIIHILEAEIYRV